jgi:hypothetical protein
MSKKQNQDIESLKSEFEQSTQVKDENLSLNDSFYKKLELFLDEKFSERFQELEKKTTKQRRRETANRNREVECGSKHCRSQETN